MIYCVFDLEADGLLDTITKIHCVSYQKYDGTVLLESGSITDYEQMRYFFLSQNILVGHNIIQYDIPAVERVLNIVVDSKLIDTLAISFYHYPIKGFKHGLEAWGEKLGFAKVKIDSKEWKGPLPGETLQQFQQKMIGRCEGDVEINKRLFHGQMDYTMAIYEDFNKVMELFDYLGFKMDCLREQEEIGIPLDKELAQKSKDELEIIIEDKVNALAEHMPKVVVKTPPKVMYKKSGEISSNGLKWIKLLGELGLPVDSEAIYEKGNPGSDKQLKEWLFSLGWEPQTFKESKATGKNLPQVSLPFGAGLCPSIKSMFEEHPFLENLNSLYKARHRFGLFKSFLESVDDSGKIYSTAHGFTNTLRLQHSKPVVNLPGVDKWWGKEIRGCLKVPNEEYLMIGSDISGLEDNTKQHYIYFYDPKYVDDMRVPGFDPHIDIAVLAEMITKEDEAFFKWYERQEEDYPFSEEQKERFKSIKKIRSSAKTVNFSATYGAGAPKIAETLKCDLPFATKLHQTYWNRNSAVKETAKNAKVKTVKGQKWLYNPVSGFWMFLKAEKDRFSTLNQSSGVYVFDSWLMRVRKHLKPLGIKVCLQYHDEILLYFKKGYKDIVTKILKDSMEEVNNKVNLNVDIGISVDPGLNYAECH